MVAQAPNDISPSGHRLLVADDDGHIREVLRFALTQAGYQVTMAKDGAEALEIFRSGQFELVVLDILMPGLDGLDLCRRIRQTSSVPLIFVSSRDEELDRILGLEMGADDYITKPFSPRELVARVKATLRRADEISALKAAGAIPVSASGGDGSAETPLRHGPLTIDRSRHECRIFDQAVVLTVSEFSLLTALVEHPGRVLSRQQLVERAYGPGHFLSDRTVDSHVRRIRSKLKSRRYECIETVYGVGYKLAEPS